MPVMFKKTACLRINFQGQIFNLAGEIGNQSGPFLSLQRSRLAVHAGALKTETRLRLVAQAQLLQTTNLQEESPAFTIPVQSQITSLA